MTANITAVWYTGHCPTLRFQYGTSYGTKTKEILQDLRDKNVLKAVQRTPYRQHNEHDKIVLQPIARTKGQMSDPALDYKNRASKYIIGYTGFIPTLNFRYGKSYGRTADDSMYEFSTKQRRLRDQKTDYDKIRAQSAPRLLPIRNSDDVKYIMNRNEPCSFKERDITPDFPPIAGYTGYIPKVKGNEESLSQRYNNVVKRSLTLMREERENHVRDLEDKKNYLRTNEDKMLNMFNNSYSPKYSYKES